MTNSEALRIVLELAKLAMISVQEDSDEYERQVEAICTVEFLTNDLKEAGQ